MADRFDPIKLAEANRVAYSGDLNPLDEGGFWYDPSTWLSDEYAVCLEVDLMPDVTLFTRHISIRKLVVNNLGPAAIARAIESCGFAADYMKDDPSESRVGSIRVLTRMVVEIESAKNYGDYEPDEGDWREPNQWAFAVSGHSDYALQTAQYAKIHGLPVVPIETVETLIRNLLAELYQGPR